MTDALSSVIVASGSYIPGRRIANDDFLGHRLYEDYDRPFEASSNAKTIERFREITGISERRYADDDLVTSDIAALAARKALADGDIDAESLDYLIVAHNFGDVRAGNPRSDMVPTLAARVKRALGIANPACVAYDLPFGCPGWVQAVIQADYYLRSGDAKRALVVGAETLSRVSDPHDRNSLIYSDGAGAAVLEARLGPRRVGILAHATRSDALDHAPLTWMGKSFDPAYEDDRLFLKMHGRRLYEYAVKTMPGLIAQSLDKAGVKLAEVAKVLIHQANSKMDEAILKRLFKNHGNGVIPDGIMPMTIARLGNSSVATVPTLLDLVRRGQLEGHTLRAGDIVVFASVGAGMNSNSVVYRCE